MGWFRKFIDEVKDEYNRIHEQEKTKQENIQKNLDIIKNIQKNLDMQQDTMRQTAEHITTSIALANLGAEKYGNPTISYGGKKYNSTMVLKAFEDKVRLNLDEITICKMMYFKLKDHVEQLQPVDEYGDHIRSEDEALNKYLLFASLHVMRLEKLIEKTSR